MDNVEKGLPPGEVILDDHSIFRNESIMFLLLVREFPPGGLLVGKDRPLAGVEDSLVPEICQYWQTRVVSADAMQCLDNPYPSEKARSFESGNE